MTTISPSAESKLYRFEAQSSSRWIEDPHYSLRKKHHSVFSEEGYSDEPLKTPVYDSEQPVHTTTKLSLKLPGYSLFVA